MKLIRFNKSKIKKIELIKTDHSKTSKKIIALVIVSLFLYTGVAIWLQYVTGVEISSTLTTCFFAFCSGELWMLASIKKSKLRSGQKNEQYSSSTHSDTNDDEPVG